MRRRLALGAAAAASLVLMGAGLSGCGFTPLYGAPGVTSKLASIKVIAPDGRSGFLVRQHLEDAFATNRGGPAAYAVKLQLAEARVPRGIRTDNVATRYEYIITADYTLANQPAGDLVKKGRVRVEVTYDSADQPYASIAAEQDAQDRATEEVARRIQLEIAAWLATGEPSGKKAQKVTPPAANSTSPSGLPSSL